MVQRRQWSHFQNHRGGSAGVAGQSHPTARPCLISGWNYAPTPEFGVWVKQALQKNAGP
jgi:hypothetical protein